MSRIRSKRIDNGTQEAPSSARRSAGPVVLATVLHIAIAAAFLHSLATTRTLDWVTAATPFRESPGEQLRYVTAVSPAKPVEPAADASPRAVTRRPPRESTRGPHSPAVTDSDSGTIPAPAASANTNSSSRAGGSGTDIVVLVPTSADPRIWNVRSDALRREPAHAEILEGSLARGIRASNDSIAALGIQTVRPDWLVTKDGHTYGIDNARIHLGRISLPAVALGALPIAGFGCMPTMYLPDRPVRDSAGIACLMLENPTVAERNERIDEMSAEIHARAAITASARAEIKRIGARKDRERARRSRAASRPPAAGEAPRVP